MKITFQLCANLNLLPLQYLTLKSLIIQVNGFDFEKVASLTFQFFQEHLLTSSGKSKQETLKSKANETGVRDAVTQYLAVSGWLPGVSVV